MTSIYYLLVKIHNYLKIIGFEIYYFKIVMYYLKTIDSLSVLYCLILEFLFLEQIVFKD